MSDVETTPKLPWWFWVITLLFLLWSLIGCGMYLAEHLMSDASYLEAFGEEMTALRGQVPWWATAGYAVGVWGGLVGIILLLLRKPLALKFFYASFAGAVIGFLPYFFDGRFRAVMAAGDWAFMLFIWAECLFIIWFTRRMIRSRRVA